MTTTTTPRAATTPDLRRTARIFAAILLPVGPACIALLRFVLPYNLTDSAEESIAGIAAEPGRQSAVVWLGFVALLTLVPAVIWVGRVTKREAPRLTAAAMVLLVPAYTALGLLVASDAVAWQGIDEGHDRAMLADLFAPSHPVMAVEAGIFVAGHVLGTILLGLAMLRTAGVPRWAAIATMVAQPLHFTAAVILTSSTLDLFAWGLNAAGFAAVSLVILGLRDDDWDLPPRTVG